MSNPLELQEGGNHYKSLKIQPVEYNQANQIPYCEGNAIKYLTRHRAKGKELDLKKAIHNCQLALKMEYGIDSDVSYGGEKEELEFKPIPFITRYNQETIHSSLDDRSEEEFKRDYEHIMCGLRIKFDLDFCSDIVNRDKHDLEDTDYCDGNECLFVCPRTEREYNKARHLLDSNELYEAASDLEQEYFDNLRKQDESN